MNVTVAQSDLSKAVAIVGRAINSRAVLPIFGNILLEAKSGELRLSGTNLNVSINCWLRATVEEEGAITVPARLFGDIVSKLQPAKVNLTDNARTVVLHLTCGNFKAKVAGISAEDFPATLAPAGERVELNPAQLAEGIDQVVFAASSDMSRPNMGCVKTSLNGRLTLAATDGYRVGVRSYRLPTPAPECNVLIPAPSMMELQRILAVADPDQPVTMSVVDKRSVVFWVEGKEGLRVELAAQLVDANFPDYHAIIPKSNTTTVGVESALLLRSLQAARLFTVKESEPVTLSAYPGKGLRVSATDKQMGDSVDEIDADIKGEGVEFVVDCSFLIDLLSRLGNTQIVLEMTRNTRPISIRPAFASPDEFVHVVMPIHPSKGG